MHRAIMPAQIGRQEMTIRYITATKHQSGKLTVHSTRPNIPHYVVNTTTEDAAIKLVNGYRTGYHWAIEHALAGDIRIDSGEIAVV